MGAESILKLREAKVKLAIRREQANSASQFSGVTLVKSGVHRDSARL
jgi:hypothetical protein